MTMEFVCLILCATFYFLGAVFEQIGFSLAQKGPEYVILKKAFQPSW